MREDLQRYRVPLLAGVGLLVLVLVVYLAWLVPEGSKLSNLNQTKASLTAQAQILQDKINTLKSTEQKLPANCTELQKDLLAIPGTTAESSFLLAVTTLAQKYSITLPTTTPPTPGPVTTGPDGLDEEPFSVVAAGSYGDVLSFLNGLDSLSRLYTINTIGFDTATESNGTITLSGAGGGATAPAVITGGTPISSTATFYGVTLTGDIYYTPNQQDLCSTTTTTTAR
jgi:Tfp pilus assembly protein PilO